MGLVALGLLNLPATALAADSAPAMLTPGGMNVGATGAFSYDVPIAVPPGTAGMAPSLSLDYSSQGGDGILGLGWALGGLPTIGRCPRTLAQDAVHGGVNYDLSDRFCMDGQRLILTSGSYGADGSQYRSEIDSFSLIIAHGQAGNGPVWFEVHTKSGQVMEFGNTTDSRPLALGKTTARAWSVDKITDTAGNYLTVTYTAEDANGESYPSRIDYTGNAAASLSTYNSVQFSYTTRTDVTPFYQAGSLTQRTQLLTDVKTYAGSSLVSDYRLTYTAGTTTRHSELTSIAQCDGAGTCLPATTFGWQGSRDNPAITAVPNGIAQGYLVQNWQPYQPAPANYSFSTRPYSADFNGDGLTDLLITGSCPSGGQIYLGTQSGGFVSGNFTANYTNQSTNPITSYSGPTCFGSPQFLDINGDGLTDVMLAMRYPGSGRGPGSFFNDFLLNNGSGNLSQVGNNYPQADGGNVNLILGDYNGDGLTDYFYNLPTPTSMCMGNGDGTFSCSNTSLPSVGSAVYTAADFDGDGCADLLEVTSTASTVNFMCARAGSTATGPPFGSGSGVTFIYGDFNGDGKTDILTIGTGNAQLYLSTGTGFAAYYTIPNSSDWYKYGIITGDWNGDGKTDIALIAPGGTGNYGVGTSHKILLSTGTGFSQIQTIANTNSADTTVTASVADWNNDGASDIWLQKPSGDTEYLFSYIPELITTVSNGLGVTTTVSYDRLNHASVYTKETGDAYPTLDMNGPAYVVSRIDSSNGIGGTYSSTYAYTGAKADLHGRGFLGFHTVSVTDLQTGVVQKTTYNQSFPYQGLIASQTKTLGGVTLTSTTNSYAATASVAGTNAQFVSVSQTVAASTDLDGSALPTVTTTYNSYDAYGDPTQITVSTPDGASKVTTNTYTNDTTHWYLGRLTAASVTSTVGSSVITRTSSFAYDPTSGLLTQEIVEPNTPSLKLQTDYVYDGFGNKHTATLSGGSGGSAIASRTTTSTFDAQGRFATTLANALNQSETWASSPSFGLPSSHTGPNGLTTTWQYDSFGRKTLETRPDGTQASFAYQYCSGVNGGTASCPANAAFLVQTTPLGSDHATHIGPVATTYYDALSRPIAQEAQGFDGTVIHTDSQFDANGRPWRASLPYFVGAGTIYWTTNSFDALGRVLTTTQPNSGVTQYAYHGLTTSVTDPNTHTTTTLKNTQGLTATVTDAAGKATTYAYDAYGELLTVTDSAGDVTTNVYDLRGRKTATNDPDKGFWTYGYDVLNELVSQTNANNQTAAVTYDLLGRVTRRTEADLTSTWTYDTAAHGIGLLAQATTNTTYSRSFTYDSLSRPTTVALAFNGYSYNYVTGYDAISGKIATVSYPSGLAVKYLYNAYGYLYQLKDNGSGPVYWTANTRDPFLNLLTETAGNGVTITRGFTPQTGRIASLRAGPGNAVAAFDYQFDLIGELTSRTDDDLARTDTFTYDALNRLSTYSIAGGATQTMGYDALGDITSKPGVGTYNYPSAGQGRPHAVASITGTVRGVTNPSFTYDGDGNTLSAPGMAAGYTSFDMPSWVSNNQGGTLWNQFNWNQAPWSSTAVSLAYDPEHHRVEMNGPSGATYYFNDPVSGAMAEWSVPATGPTQWRDYLIADGRMVAERTAVNGGSTTWQYFIADHLGSIAVTADASGAVLQRMIYDPWGVQLAQDNSQLCGTGATTRGFTGEEQFPVDCLVNLNARLYDPILGKFLAGDPIISSVFDQQALNRYSYVQNNPLSLTDTDGQCGIFCFFLIFFAVDVTAVEVLKPVLEHNPILGDLLVIAESLSPCGPICGAEAAGIVSGVESGNVGKGLEAFALNYAESVAFDFAGSKLGAPPKIFSLSYTAESFVAHGLIGGTFSVLQGGNFGSGFLSAGVSDLAAPYVTHTDRTLGAIESAVIGGTASVVGGGKFENGAVTGAFAYLADPRNWSSSQQGAGEGSSQINPDQQGSSSDSTSSNGATFQLTANSGATICVGATAGAAGSCLVAGGAAAACPETGVSCVVVPEAGQGCVAGAALALGACNAANPDRPSDRAIKSQCIRQCTPLLDRPQRPGSDRNQWDFQKCVSECIKDKEEYWR